MIASQNDPTSTTTPSYFRFSRACLPFLRSCIYAYIRSMRWPWWVASRVYMCIYVYMDTYLYIYDIHTIFICMYTQYWCIYTKYMCFITVAKERCKDRARFRKRPDSMSILQIVAAPCLQIGKWQGGVFHICVYGVTLVSRIDKIIGLFCKRAL